MNAQRYTVRAPGKLFIAGEYAITEKNHTSIVAAVDRYLSVDIQSSRLNRLDLPNLGLTDINWRFDNDKLKMSHKDSRLRFISSVMKTVYQYKGEDTPAHIFVTSELDDEEGYKYGLGSSAALTVALTKALLRCGGEDNSSSMTVFKLAAIAHYKAQGNGSCADIAASVFGGYIFYRSFDFEWLKANLEEHTPIPALVEQEWPNLHISVLPAPEDLHLLVGWTKEEASTKDLVEHVARYKATHEAEYQAFLAASDKAVATIAEGFTEHNVDLILTGIKANRKALKTLGTNAGVEIETEKLTRLIEAAPTGAAKSSGAGGGDCGIVYTTTTKNHPEIITRWEENDIEALDLFVSPFGVTID